MRLTAGTGILAALLVGPIIAPGTIAQALTSPEVGTGDGWRISTAKAVPADNGDGDGDGDGINDTQPLSIVQFSHITALRVSPWRPRRDSDLRIEVRCPSPSTHATVASPAIDPTGSRRGSRELGIGLDDNGYGHDTEGVPFDARLGIRPIWLRCVKAEVNDDSLVRHVKLVSRLVTTVKVRRHIVPTFRCGGVGFSCKKWPNSPDRPHRWRNAAGDVVKPSVNSPDHPRFRWRRDVRDDGVKTGPRHPSHPRYRWN
ncbi:hypothetical protein [Spongiactinospora sp. TRM90649]|uniref:hypothetical protein n=1 Tax=Spongiactinospora sp. TRM90649 TaxID=3031114 RepID=UPI0023F6E7CE|nr:hypothetical protein [Spongiactinospora sp. TRM90649]MDF5755615.1 hypothetical protein [Spongiactinospora sp. TRM90649]